MRIGPKYLIIALVCLAVLATSSSFAMAKSTNTVTTAVYGAHKKQLTQPEMVQWTYNALQIQNVFSRHAYYHRYGQHKEELENIWVQKPENQKTMTFGQNHGYYVGWDKIYAYYVTVHDEMWQNQLEKYKQYFQDDPEKLADIEANPEKYLGAGEFIIHTLTTPVIEIAEDGQTAKAMWYSPGALDNAWIWEQYGVDFKKEDGEWKIWHMHLYTDFSVQPGESWYKDTIPSGPPFGSDPSDLMTPNIPVPNYDQYSKETVKQVIPVPVPYKTFKETFSYGPSAELLWEYLDLTEE